MKCLTPKHLFIHPLKDNKQTLYSVYVPCGKCYACQCNSRAEWALRCQYELKDKRNVSCAFVTCTYDNDNLPHVLSHNQFKHLVNLEMLKPISQRDWDFSLLNPRHATKLLNDMQKELKKITGNKKLLFRYFLTGEYGDISHRPHLHLLIFSPVPFTLIDYQNIFKKIWRYGNVDVAADGNAAIINYLAKHQVKSCCGTLAQQKVSPIFKRTSKYGGGLGRTMKNDLILRHRFFSDDDDKKFLEVQQGEIIYKISYPRFLIRHYRQRTLEEWELSNLAFQSRKRFYDDIDLALISHPELKNIDRDVEILQVIKFRRSEDFKARKKYEFKRKLVKINKLINNQKRINYEHF